MLWWSGRSTFCAIASPASSAHATSSANCRRRPIDRVIFLVLPTVEILDLAGPLQAFAEANALSPRYTIETVSTHTQVESAQGVTLSNLEQLTPASENSLVVVPGVKYSATERTDRRVTEWLRDAYESGATIASVC